MKATVTKVSKRIAVRDVKKFGILSYDVDNNYPNRARDIYAASGAGKSCVNLYRKFIFGKGFQDTIFAKRIINRFGLTPDKLLRKIVKDYSDIGGFALHVNYNALYEICDINFQPISQVRFTSEENETHPNMYAICKDWEKKKIEEKDVFYINKFNPNPVVIQAEVEKAGGWGNYRGQIFYFSNLEDKYPEALYDAELEDMQTDAEAKTYKFRNVTTNFLASHILITSKIEGTGENAEGQADEQRSELHKTLEDYQGADNAQKIMHVEKESEDQTFDLKKVEQQAGDKLYQYTESSVRDNIRQSFLIPAILLTAIPGKLGASSEIIDATNYYNYVTEDERLNIEEAMRELFTYFHDKTIIAKGNFSIVAKGNISNNTTNTKYNALDVLIDQSLSPQQKIEALIILFGYDQEDAKKLVLAPDVVNKPPIQA